MSPADVRPRIAAAAIRLADRVLAVGIIHPPGAAPTRRCLSCQKTVDGDVFPPSAHRSGCEWLAYFKLRK